MACRGCGFELSPDFAFCPRCGAAQGAVGAKAEASGASAPGEPDRRLVTVLFADVAGFTTLAERLDPEEVRSFQNALFDALTRSVERYDGFVEKYIGDAVMAVFGAPVAHENDPERALDSALDMVERCAALSERWARRLGQQVGLHIGVHTGPVVAGSLGGGAGAAYAVTGDTVNTTARLLAASSGAILVSDATCALTRHRFAFEPACELTLRGKTAPVAAHRLLGALSEPRSARGLAAYGLTAPLIGRVGEIDQLLAAFDRMRAGEAQSVSLIGEAGVGKSRLISEFLDRLASDGAGAGTAVRRIACSSLGEPTYGVFGALFREGYRVEQDASLEIAQAKLAAGLDALGAKTAEAEAIAPLLSSVLGVEEARPRDVEPEQLKRQITMAARTLLEHRLRQGPLLMIVDDMHWADAASGTLLRDLADHFASRPLMLLLSHRPDASPLPVERARRSVIQLAPLSSNETRAFVDALFGAVSGDAFIEIQHLVTERAGGNPLFIEEIVRNLVSKGALSRQGDRWACAVSNPAVDVPPTLHGLLLSRIDRLPAGARRLLQEAAVLGITFDEPLLRAIASHPQDVERARDALMEADMIAPAGRGGHGDRYRFTHALAHEAAYQNLLLSRRTELHEKAGRALEQITGPRPERLSDLEALGHHWSLGPDKVKGARYLTAAGDWARSRYANDDAIRHYARALRTLDDCDRCDDQARAVRERLADLLALTGRRAEALAHYEAARQGLEDIADAAGVARLHRKIGGLHWEAGDRASASACFAQGLDKLGENGAAIERAQLFQEIGRLAFRAGDNGDAIAWAQRALMEATRDADAASDPEREREAAAMRAQAYNTLGVALARTGRPGDAVKQIEQSIALAEANDLLQAACRGYANLGVLYSALNPRQSIDTCLRGLETAKKVGDLGFQSRLYTNLAVSYCALTDRCQAEGVEAAQMAIDLDRRLDLLDHLAIPLIVIGQIRQCRGEHALAFAAYEEALDLAERAGEPQILFPCYDGLATLYLSAGDHASAERYLMKSQEVCERAGVEPDALMVLPFLC